MLERILALIAMLAMMAPWTKTSHPEVLSLHVLPANVCQTHPGKLVIGKIYNPNAEFHTVSQHYRAIRAFSTKNPECNGEPLASFFGGAAYWLGKTKCNCAQNRR